MVDRVQLCLSRVTDAANIHAEVDGLRKVSEVRFERAIRVVGVERLHGECVLARGKIKALAW